MECKTAAIILAGGMNTRMQGRDKAFLEIGGRPIIAGIIEKLKPLVSEVIVVTNVPEKYNEFDVKAVRDEVPRKGPLMGIYSGLKNSSAQYNVVVACDMPFIKEELISRFVAIADGYDIVVPMVGEKAHPLFGIYSRNCIPVIEEQIKKGELKISDIFPKLKTHFVARQEMEKFDKELVSLTNINTRAEYARI